MRNYSTLIPSVRQPPTKQPIMKTINWTTATGTAIEINVSTDYLLNSQGVRKTSGEMEVVITAKVNGERHSTIGGIQSVTGHPTCVAQIGNIGLTTDNLALITAAIDAAESSIADHNAAIEAHADSLDRLGNGDINKVFGAHC
jgi:hypothetical protein